MKIRCLVEKIEGALAAVRKKEELR